MPRGENAILRENGKPEPTWQRLLKRNATQTELLQAQVQQIGQEFEADGHTYTVKEVKIDTLHRLIAIGKLTEVSSEPAASEYPLLEPIYGGKWAARGDGWAVHGATREEAIENYHKAEFKHQEIAARPPRQKE
jgi:hypothetical protein